MKLLARLRLLLARAVAEFSQDNCSQMAAAISYYILFSLFPLLIFSVGVLGVLLQDSKLQNDLIDAILDNIPLTEDEGRDDVTTAVRGVAGVGSGALGVAGLLGMAWSGSNMFGVIRRSLNTAYDLSYRRPFLRQKLLDLALVVGFAPFFLASVVVTTALQVARSTSQDLPVLGPAADAIGPGWSALALLVPMTVSFLAFLVLYWIVPAAKIRPGDVWLGALFAALLFEGAKVGFGVYVANFGNYDVVFGSLGAVVAFLFWVFISANIMLFGAEVASEYPRVMRGDYDGQPAAPRAAAQPLATRVWRFLRGLVMEDGR